MDAAAVADRVLENAHVFLVPGIVFGKGGSGYLRLSLCSPVPTLNEALSLIRKSIGSSAGRAS
jgi:aspartate/methionine/tyrosine aminotransferase